MKKSKVIIYDDLAKIDKQIVYCNCYENRPETNEDIIRSIKSEFLVDKFDKNKFEYDNHEIKNDTNLYITVDINNNLYIWQICGKVTDMNNVFIPNAYYVRKIGYIVDTTDIKNNFDKNNELFYLLGAYSAIQSFSKNLKIFMEELDLNCISRNIIEEIENRLINGISDDIKNINHGEEFLSSLKF